MIQKLQSALSTLRDTVSAVREVPAIIREAIAFARENSEIKEELSRANAVLDNGVSLHLEWINKANLLAKEVELLTATLGDIQDEYAKELERHRETERENNELQSKLARYEAAEKWHQVTRGEGELPPPIPVLWRNNRPDFPLGELNYCIQGACGTYEWRFLSSEDVPQ